MNFEEAKADLISQGFAEGKIRRMKVHLTEPWPTPKIRELNAWQAKQREKLQKLIEQTQDSKECERLSKRLQDLEDLPEDAGGEVFPVYEEGPDKQAERDADGNLSETSRIVYYALNQGTRNRAEKEFWIPCAYDGVKTWVENNCAPDWIENPEEQRAFCTKHYRQKSWPDENGETAEDPIRFVKSELSLLRSSDIFKGSSDIDRKFRQKSLSNMRLHSAQAFDYLSKAIEISLKRNEPEHRQVSQERLRQGETVTPYVDPEPMRIIEMAFRAGREAATATLHYRGVPIDAEQGKPLTDRQSKTGPKKQWTQVGLEFLRAKPKAKSSDVAIHLYKECLIDWEPSGDYRDAHTVIFYDKTPNKSRTEFQKAVSKLRKKV